MSEEVESRKPKAEIAAAMQTPAQRDVQALQHKLAKQPQIDCPLTHSFIPGFYCRQIFMPAGTLVISKIHKTEHPYVITQGRVSVWIEGVGVRHLTAPHTGITTPGTRRVLYVHEDCVWTTFHASDQTDLADLEKQLIYSPESSLEIPDGTVADLMPPGRLAELKGEA